MSSEIHKGRIDGARLSGNLERLACFGRSASGGIHRSAFSEADRQAKDWLTGKMLEAGLRCRRDAADNLWGRLDGQGPAVLAGSHLDVVPDGGMFDGAVGVLAALECLQAVREQALPHRRPLEAVAFCDEEGAYLSLMGSRAVAGDLSPAELATGRNMTGISLQDAMAAVGLDIANIDQARRDPGDLHAYLELHIEQGPRLEESNIPIGIVQSIVGIISCWVTFTGEANHAGTTPMARRRDALLGAAEFALQVTAWVRDHSNAVVTCGNLEAKPGAFNIVPGKVRLALEFRDTRPENLETINSKVLEIGQEIARTRQLTFELQRASSEAPVCLSRAVIETIRSEAEALGYTYQMMDSGAGHDAQILAPHVQAGMIFIPSRAGKSHCPEEFSSRQAVEQGAQLLLNSLLHLANQ